MKKTYSYKAGKKTIERSYSYIPIRYIIAAFLMLFEVCAVVAIVLILCYYLPLFYIAAWITEIFCVLYFVPSPPCSDTVYSRKNSKKQTIIIKNKAKTGKITLLCQSFCIEIYPFLWYNFLVN